MIPEGENALVSVSMVGERLVTTALVDVVSQVDVYGLDGAHVRTVELPGPMRAAGFGGRIADPAPLCAETLRHHGSQQSDGQQNHVLWTDGTSTFHDSSAARRPAAEAL